MDSTSNIKNAYVILVNDDNSMTITQKKRIVQRSKLVDTLFFLVGNYYNGKDMSEFTVLIEYLLPNSRKYLTEILTLSDSDYNGYLKYTLPIDTELTSEAGDIELQMTFAKSDLDPEGNPIQLVRKISAVTISVIPISAWSDIIPDSALSAIDQRLIKADAQIRALDEIFGVISTSKADNIKYDTSSGELQLLSGGNAIGDKVVIVSCDESCGGDDSNPDYVSVVEF